MKPVCDDLPSFESHLHLMRRYCSFSGIVIFGINSRFWRKFGLVAVSFSNHQPAKARRNHAHITTCPSFSRCIDRTHHSIICIPDHFRSIIQEIFRNIPLILRSRRRCPSTATAIFHPIPRAGQSLSRNPSTQPKARQS